MSQVCYVSPTEGESFYRGIFDLSEVGAPMPMSAMTAEALGKTCDVLVCVRNGVEFSLEQFKSVLSAYAKSDVNTIVAAPARFGQLYMHGVFGEEPTAANLSYVEFNPRLVQTGVKPGVTPWASMCLAVMSPGVFQGITPGLFFDYYQVKNQEITHVDFDRGLALALAISGTVKYLVTDTVIAWYGAIDVHTVFHQLVTDFKKREGLEDPRSVSVDAKLLLGPYLDSYRRGDLLDINASVSNIAMTVLDILQKIGCQVNTSGLGLDDLMVIGLSGAAKAAEPVALPAAPIEPTPADPGQVIGDILVFPSQTSKV